MSFSLFFWGCKEKEQEGRFFNPFSVGGPEGKGGGSTGVISKKGIDFLNLHSLERKVLHDNKYQ